MQRPWQRPCRRVYLLVFLPLLASMILHSLALMPLYLSMGSDVNWSGTLLHRILGYLLLLLEYAFFWFLFAFLSKTMGKWNPAFYLFPILFACIFGRVLELVMGYAVFGFPTWEEFCEEELGFTLLQVLLDCVLIAVAALAILIFKKPRVKSILLPALPVLFQLLSLALLLFKYDPLTRKAFLAEAGIDFIVHIVCFFVGFGVIMLCTRLLEREGTHDKML